MAHSILVLDLTGFEIDNIEDVAMTAGDDGVTIDLFEFGGETILLAGITTLLEAGDFIASNGRYRRLKHWRGPSAAQSLPVSWSPARRRKSRAEIKYLENAC